MHEFYANLGDKIVVEGEDQYESLLWGHIYEFSPRVICEFLSALIQPYVFRVK